MGRKRNVAFILNTQHAMDVLEGNREEGASGELRDEDPAEVGRGRHRSCWRGIRPFRNQKGRGAELLAGEGLLIAENVHMPVNFLATKEKHMIFTTKPSEATYQVRKKNIIT